MSNTNSDIHESKQGFASFQIDVNPRIIQFHHTNPLESMRFDEIFTRLTKAARAEIFRFSMELTLKRMTRLFLYAALQDYPNLKGESLWNAHFTIEFDGARYRKLKCFAKRIAATAITDDGILWMIPPPRSIEMARAKSLWIKGDYDNCLRKLLTMGKLNLTERFLELSCLANTKNQDLAYQYENRKAACIRFIQRNSHLSKKEAYLFIDDPSTFGSNQFLFQQMGELNLSIPLSQNWNCPEWIFKALKGRKP